jgi:DNA polymerase III epsilon subunit-like protein
MSEDHCRFLVVDTETTGLFVNGVDEMDSSQPYPVQIAAALFDLREDGYQWQLNHLVKVPAHAIIDPKSVEIHRISREMIEVNGVSPLEVYKEIREMARIAERVTAYNLEFDERIIRTSSMRMYPGVFDNDPVLGNPEKQFCSMKFCQPLFKQPRQKLEQVYRRLFGTTIIDAHDAMADVLATADVLRALMRQVMETVEN